MRTFIAMFTITPQLKADSFGLYPGSDGHGKIISPTESAQFVISIQRSVDAAFDKVIDDTWFFNRVKKSYLRNVIRFVGLFEAIGTNDGNKFVYTCKYGWIDHGHFFNNATLTYLRTRPQAEFLSGANEIGQQIGGSNSAWTPEDLVSNELGRRLGQKAFWNDAKGIALYWTINPFSRVPKSMFYDMAHHWMMLLKNSGAVKWNPRTIPVLKRDLKDFEANPRNDIYTIAQSRKYYESTRTWQCLCKGDKPKKPADRY